MTASPDPISPALERILTRYAAMVRDAARSRQLDESGIDEVFQEVRVRLWRALRTGERIGEVPASYVYRTAVSAVLDLIRRRRARREEKLDELPDAPVSTNAGPTAALEGEETLAMLERALGALVESRRVVVRMHLGGYHLTEIAQQLGWSEPKTRNLLYRGLADLRARLTELGLGPEAVA